MSESGKILSDAELLEERSVLWDGVADTPRRDKAWVRLRQDRAALRELVSRIAMYWPRIEGGRVLCPTCGLGCPRYEDCMIPELKAAGILDADGKHTARAAEVTG